MAPGETHAEEEPAVVDDAALRRAEELIEKEEGAARRFSGRTDAAITWLAVAMSLFHLYAAYAIIPAQILRAIHLGFVLFLLFLVFPAAPRFRDRIRWFDVAAALLGVATIAWLLLDFDEFIERAVTPNRLDLFFGVALVLLVLEAVRRTSGWFLASVVALFLVYAFVGPWLPRPWTHRGYDVERLVGQLYMTLEGIFGTPIDVSATFIILFTIYGAVLQFTGAGEFFIDFSLAVTGGTRAAAGRTIVLASFLLGGPSGSGVATTVTLGSVAWPMLARAGYPKNAAGGLLAAGGLGAIISPPVLGAAAFLIAEFLKISYMDVIWMATIPTGLYYLALFLMVDLDARKLAVRDEPVRPRQGVWRMIRERGFHFTSLVAVVVFMVLGFSPIVAVFWATLLAAGLSFLRRDSALTPVPAAGQGLHQSRLVQALRAGSVGVLAVAATCASAGIIVGVVTLTGLGLKFSSIVIDLAGGNLLLTAVFTALVVWIVGLAVPVTASYIICAVIAVPALTKLGVPDYAAHMFVFYYAVLSEVSPPTALSPFAAAAITGGDPYLTTLQSWKYTLPAFLVPFAFVLDPSGVGLLLKGSPLDVVRVTVTAFVGIAALACGVQGWMFRRTTVVERGMLVAAGLLLVYPTAWADLAGIALVAAAVALQRWHRPAPG
ncbi:MAG TPA: TRAP transporter fused permease subunit [Anaeromyxobacteraceae bacterium]|nr:TRAP transporter fused permease subunit [Anaeromyxobacteraceae bacterium]